MIFIYSFSINCPIYKLSLKNISIYSWFPTPTCKFPISPCTFTVIFWCCLNSIHVFHNLHLLLLHIFLNFHHHFHFQLKFDWGLFYLFPIRKIFHLEDKIISNRLKRNHYLVEEWYYIFSVLFFLSIFKLMQ